MQYCFPITVCNSKPIGVKKHLFKSSSVDLLIVVISKPFVISFSSKMFACAYSKVIPEFKTTNKMNKL